MSRFSFRWAGTGFASRNPRTSGHLSFPRCTPPPPAPNCNTPFVFPEATAKFASGDRSPALPPSSSLARALHIPANACRPSLSCAPAGSPHAPHRSLPTGSQTTLPAPTFALDRPTTASPDPPAVKSPSKQMPSTSTRFETGSRRSYPGCSTHPPCQYL